MVVDPLVEATDLVEVQANTKENLKKAIKIYEEKLADTSIPAPKRAVASVDLARAYLRLGDLEKSDDAKITYYTKGQKAAAAAFALDPKNSDAYFYEAANHACIGRTKGVMNSLFMLPDLRKNLNKALELNPNNHYARQTLGEIDHAVPGIAGGSDDRAEKAYLEILKRDPNFTPAMTHLATLYKDKGKDEEAKKWAQKALDTKSSVPNDWKKFDKNDAKKILKELED